MQHWQYWSRSLLLSLALTVVAVPALGAAGRDDGYGRPTDRVAPIGEPVEERNDGARDSAECGFDGRQRDLQHARNPTPRGRRVGRPIRDVRHGRNLRVPGGVIRHGRYARDEVIKRLGHEWRCGDGQGIRRDVERRQHGGLRDPIERQRDVRRRKPVRHGRFLRSRQPRWCGRTIRPFRGRWTGGVAKRRSRCIECGPHVGDAGAVAITA